MSGRLREFTSIAARLEHETVVKKSRFICTLTPVDSSESAAAELAIIKKKHYNATHNCSAAVVGADCGYMHASDDGEPQGTAGVPMLDVLKKNGLTNLLAVVTRYFGGTLLGAGGLARAYTGSVSDALKLARRVVNIPAIVYLFSVGYADYGKLCGVAAEFGAQADAAFAEDVKARVVLRQTYGKQFQNRITQAFMGANIYRVLEETYIRQII